MKAEQPTLFDAPQEMPARVTERAVATQNAPALTPTPATPTEPQEGAERNRRAHAGLEEFIAGHW
jgi:hypothetical protein